MSVHRFCQSHGKSNIVIKLNDGTTAPLDLTKDANGEYRVAVNKDDDDTPFWHNVGHEQVVMKKGKPQMGGESRCTTTEEGARDILARFGI